MDELINTNVFASTKKFVDLKGLDYFWEKAKEYVDGLAVNYDAKGDAAKALADAKVYADGKYTAMNTRVAALEAIDHEKIAADAASTAVAGVIDGAPEKFDTLKEIAAWIAEADTAEDAASLVTRVSNLEKIDHNAYVAADKTVLSNANSYADGLAVNYDAKGDAAKALVDAKSYADGLADNYDAAGAAAQALKDAKADAAEKYQPKGNYEAAGAAATAKSEAIAQAKIDAAKALEAYYEKTETYSKTEVNGLLSTNSEADKAYAKQYTDALFNSFKFAANSDIDALFAVKVN